MGKGFAELVPLKHQKHRGRCRATDLIADIWHVVLVKLGNLVIVFIRQTRHVNFILVIFDFKRRRDERESRRIVCGRTPSKNNLVLESFGRFIVVD